MEMMSQSVASAYAANRPATAPAAGNGGTIFNAAADFTATLNASETQAVSAMTGNGDPHVLVQALAQAELAVETVVTVRDKVVEAYQEILRMPV